ncbi:MAG: TspO/MBR family protein [Flavobacteriales bacterium]
MHLFGSQFHCSRNWWVFTGPGVSSEWYQNLNQAPWTPPSWVYGVAWTLIMVCFAFFMTFCWEAVKKKVVILFGIQWILNIIWNPIFFSAQEVLIGLLVISSLTLNVLYELYFFVFLLLENLKHFNY